MRGEARSYPSPRSGEGGRAKRGRVGTVASKQPHPGASRRPSPCGGGMERDARPAQTNTRACAARSDSIRFTCQIAREASAPPPGATGCRATLRPSSAFRPARMRGTERPEAPPRLARRGHPHLGEMRGGTLQEGNVPGISGGRCPRTLARCAAPKGAPKRRFLAGATLPGEVEQGGS